MEAENPYRTNEFCVNWQDNLLATSMGDAFEVGKQEGRRDVVEWMDSHCDLGHCKPEDVKREWLSQCKEWGL